MKVQHWAYTLKSWEFFITKIFPSYSIWWQQIVSLESTDQKKQLINNNMQAKQQITVYPPTPKFYLPKSGG